VASTPLFWLGKTPYVAAVTITSGLLNIGLNLLLIPSMKMQGAAVATLICCAFQFVAAAALAHKWFPLPYEYGRLAKIMAATAVCYSLAVITSNYSGFWWHFAIKLGLLGAYPLLLVLLRFPTMDERKTLAKIIKAMARRIRTTVGRGRHGAK